MDTCAINFSIRPARPARHLPPLKPVVLAVLAALAGPALAQPVTNQLPVRNATAPINATVGAVAGTAGNPVLPVTQQTSANNRAVVEWSSFNVGSGARVDFVQPNAQSVLLNRVVGGSGNSQIYGGLTANGRIFIVNPFGVYFGGTSQVNVGSLVASSLDLTPAMADNNYQGFLNGTGIDLAGSGQFGVQTASDSAANKITAAQGGSVALIGGGFVSAGGNIDAPGGRIAMAVAPAVRVVPVGQSGFVDLAITTPGASGAITVGGVLNASSALAGTQGGQIVLQAPTITTYFGEPGESVLSADGPAGGGTITLGDTNTRAVTVEQGSIPARRRNRQRQRRLDRGARDLRLPCRSAAGRSRASTFGVAEVYGTLQARGGVNGGNGGRIETSGTAVSTSLSLPGSVVRGRHARRTRAFQPQGTAGTWTLDPFDVTITNAATVAVNGSFQPTGLGANVRARRHRRGARCRHQRRDQHRLGHRGQCRRRHHAGRPDRDHPHHRQRADHADPARPRQRDDGGGQLHRRRRGCGRALQRQSVQRPRRQRQRRGLDGRREHQHRGRQRHAERRARPGHRLCRGQCAVARRADAGLDHLHRRRGDARQRDDPWFGFQRQRQRRLAKRRAHQQWLDDRRRQHCDPRAGWWWHRGEPRQRGAGHPGRHGRVAWRGPREPSPKPARWSAWRSTTTPASRWAPALCWWPGAPTRTGWPPGTAAVGLRADDVRISGAAQSGGRVMLVGQSVGSTAPGIAAQDVEANGIDIAIDNDGSFAPIGANIVIGASAGAQAPAALGLSTSTLRGLTNGAVNLRPLGVGHGRQCRRAAGGADRDWRAECRSGGQLRRRPGAAARDRGCRPAGCRRGRAS